MTGRRAGAGPSSRGRGRRRSHLPRMSVSSATGLTLVPPVTVSIEAPSPSWQVVAGPVGDMGDEPYLLANLPAGTRTLAVRVLSSENVVISATAVGVMGLEPTTSTMRTYRETPPWPALFHESAGPCSLPRAWKCAQGRYRAHIESR
jgi:hypothetical protein